MKWILRLLFLSLSFSLLNISFAQTGNSQKIQKLLDSLQAAGNFPGLSLAISFDPHKTFTAVAGYATKGRTIALRTTDRFLQGSVGKTYVSAIALMLVAQKKINLEDQVSIYLGRYTWYKRIPNAEQITIRMLLNHTSGVMRYEFKEKFTHDLTENPGREWRPEELLEYVWDEKAPFAAGEGWDYSDTNYILLGMIIEQVTGEKYYELLEKNILDPQRLSATFPSDRRKLEGLVQGHAGAENEFGGKDELIGEDGLFIINPQFEWTGGGIYSTTEDLVKWGKLLYEGNVIDTSLLFSKAVPAKLGKDTKYAQGVIIRPTPLGVAYGHSGFFPGYMTEMLYFPVYKICVAVQTNTSDFKTLKLGLLKVLIEVAKSWVRE